MSENDSSTPTTSVAARFHSREDAERAVEELREVGFAAAAIDAIFGVPPKPFESLDNELKSDHPILAEAGAPGNTASDAAEAVLPDTPITTLTGGSPFGEASSYIPGQQDEEPGPNENTRTNSVTVRSTSERGAEAKSILERNNGVITPTLS